MGDPCSFASTQRYFEVDMSTSLLLECNRRFCSIPDCSSKPVYNLTNVIAWHKQLFRGGFLFSILACPRDCFVKLSFTIMIGVAAFNICVSTMLRECRNTSKSTEPGILEYAVHFRRSTKANESELHFRRNRVMRGKPTKVKSDFIFVFVHVRPVGNKNENENALRFTFVFVFGHT